MRKYLDGKMLQAQMKLQEYAVKLITNEDGDTNFVSIILIIVIVIALATLFKNTLTELAGNVLGKLTDFVG